MRRPSVTDRLRHAQRERVASLSPGERVRLALELGRRDLELYALRCGIPPLEVRRAVERRAQARRRRSGCLEALLARVSSPGSPPCSSVAQRSTR